MLLGFKKRFAEPIQIGTKVFTMRVDRKVQPKIGETLYMYTGLRTANCMLITNKEKLISMQRVQIEIDMHAQLLPVQLLLWVNHRPLSWHEIEQFVTYDGFADVPDFLDWWTAGGKHKRVGGYLDLYHWTDLRY